MKEQKKKPGPKPKPVSELANVSIRHFHTQAIIEAAGGREKATEIAKTAVEKAAKKK